MPRAPAFQWYPKDCDTDESVRGMDDREFGFYMRCLNHSWLNEGLPADLAELARVIGRPPAYVRKVWPRVGRCFSEKNGRFFNEKQEAQRGNVREFVDRQRKAAEAKWKKTQVVSDAVALPVQCSASASASPTASAIQEEQKQHAAKTAALSVIPRSRAKRHRTTEEIRKALGDRISWWEAFWAVYPCHEGMNPAMDAFERRITAREMAEQAYRGAKAYAARCAANPELTVKYAQGWLNEERWLDENRVEAKARDSPRKASFLENVNQQISESLARGETPW